VKVRAIEPRDRQAWAQMRAALWPDQDPDLLAHETMTHFGADKPKQLVLVAEATDGALVGMLELAMRPYAEGCATSPVPFVEGWYVVAEARMQGIGRRLVEAAERWALARGFTEIASDTQLANGASQEAHLKLGFEEAERIVCFRKSLRA
jgi:aminoglycoside 6'-N-acetyltransferase I